MAADETMTVSTLNYPDNYTNSEKCFFGFICTTKNTKLNMTFDTFNVESSANCSKDMAVVYDGNRVDSPVMGKLCGPKSGLGRTAFRASSSKMLLRFHTDATVTDKGFQVTVSCPGKSHIFEFVVTITFFVTN